MTPIAQFLKIFASMLRSGRMSYGDALTRFRAQFGRPAEGMEKIALMKEVKKAPSNVVEFPKNRITDWWKPRPTGPTEEVVTASPDRIRKGFSTQMKLNSPRENNKLVKNFIGRKNAEFNSLSREKQKEILDMFDAHRTKQYDEAVKNEERMTELDPDYIPDIIDPEDMASGGIAGQLHLNDGGIARVGMAIGGFTKAQVLIQMLKNTIKGSKDPYVKKTFPKWIKEIQANPSLANNENVWKNLTTGLPKNQRLIVHSDDSVDFFRQTEFGPHNIEKTLEFQKKHNLSRDQANTILKMEPEDRVLEMKRLETIRNKTMQAEGGRVPLMYGGDPGFAFEYGGSWADWHDQHRDQMPVEQYIKTKLPKDRLPFRALQSGGLAYMLGEPTYMKYGAGGSVGHAPWHKPTGHKQPEAQQETPTPNVATRPDPLKAPRGIPSLAPRTMDPAYMQQEMMKKAMMGQGPRPMANEGGRIGFDKGGFDPSKRKFLKASGAGLALLSSLPFIGKFFKAAKLAKPTAAVTETIVKSNAPGMPAWFPSLVKRVVDEGTDVTKQFGTVEREMVHATELPSGTKVLVTQDLSTGDTMVDIGLGKHGWGAGRHGQPTRLALRKGEWIEPTKRKKGIKTKDEFVVEEAEFTGGHPENIKFEETVDFKYGDHGSDFSEVERYAIGKNKDKKIVGKQAARDEWAEGRAMEQAEDIDDFASGGLAYLLGE
jgi:hypothetical protein